MWSLERIGIANPVENQTAAEMQQAAIVHFQRSLKVNDEGRYEVTLPWLKLHPTVPEGKDLAERRLRTTVKRLKTANILEAYQEVLQMWLKAGIIEELKEDEIMTTGHFLPHRGSNGS
ncbi:uncharacterized protein LOC118205477 [Stegodyphus dumicola]|uniref:uncharacterized protein LOC118205477 n=1 Tax=Stegodyphus dumicola TaxID=202533 RepID=UPI0015A9181B|nr:uncharacterized protein LOC118205477 [Stegodyphus dumicola]